MFNTNTLLLLLRMCTTSIRTKWHATRTCTKWHAIRTCNKWHAIRTCTKWHAIRTCNNATLLILTFLDPTDTADTGLTYQG